jgi:predicted metalloprotease
VGGRGIGLGTIAIALVVGWIFGINLMTILGALSGGDLAAPSAQVQTAPRAGEKPTDDMGRFSASVLGGTEDVWTQLFQHGGAQYQKPTLVLFRGSTPNACGTGQAAMGPWGHGAMGPFYCPGDQKVYINLGFYDTLRQQLGAPGDFAQAYVIAHEAGHHT